MPPSFVSMGQAKSPSYVIDEGGWIIRLVVAVALGLG